MWVNDVMGGGDGNVRSRLKDECGDETGEPLAGVFVHQQRLG